MESIWGKFINNYSQSAKNVLGADASIRVIRAKILAYNTLRLGISGYKDSLVAEARGFHVFIDDLRAEIPVSDEQSKHLLAIWKRLELESKNAKIKKGPPKTKTASILRRYEYFSKSQKGNIGQSLCLSADFIYEWLTKADFFDPKTTLEAFSGFFNHYLTNWCSLFEDLEIPEGSKGSFFRLGDKINNYDLIISNPPYQNPILERTSKILAAFEGTSISVIPDWRSEDEDTFYDVCISGSGDDLPRRWPAPYPAFEILRNSPKYKGTLFSNRITFQNNFSGGKRTPEVSIIIVVLGDEYVWNSLVKNFSK
jgi:hypothetical protein